jgi:ribonuclease P/MRP protein subunit POP7
MSFTASSASAVGAVASSASGNTKSTSSTSSTSDHRPFDVSAELATLQHEKKNHNLHRLPPNYTVQRRPLNHAPVANIRAGAAVPKVVYVSQQTPLMAAVKRVKKILGHIEKRAMQQAGVTMAGKDRDRRHRIKAANETITRNKEEVLVKASGRAMSQALRVGEWFRNKEKEFLCDVAVRTGSASVVDDLVEVPPQDEGEEGEKLDEGDGDGEEAEKEETTIEYGDTTLEIIGHHVATSSRSVGRLQSSADTGQDKENMEDEVDDEQVKKSTRAKRKKRKRPMYAEDDVPEARLRHIKTVEIAITLQG